MDGDKHFRRTPGVVFVNGSDVKDMSEILTFRFIGLKELFSGSESIRKYWCVYLVGSHPEKEFLHYYYIQPILVNQNEDPRKSSLLRHIKSINHTTERVYGQRHHHRTFHSPE